MIIKTLNSVTYGQCDARPTVIFPAVGQNCPLTAYQIIHLGDRGVLRMKHLPEVVTRQRNSRESNPQLLSRKSNALPAEFTRDKLDNRG